MTGKEKGKGKGRRTRRYGRAREKGDWVKGEESEGLRREIRLRGKGWRGKHG